MASPTNSCGARTPSPPTVNSPKSTAFGMPDYRHYSNWFDQNFSPHALRLFLRGVKGKKLHSITLGAPDKVHLLKALAAAPNSEGKIVVDQTVYILHEKPNIDGVNRLIPISGPNVRNYTGAKVHDLMVAFLQQKKAGLTFEAFVKSQDEKSSL